MDSDADVGPVEMLGYLGYLLAFSITNLGTWVPPQTQTLTVYLSSSEHHVAEVPVTPETLCRDVLEICREPGESQCYLAEMWRDTGTLINTLHYRYLINTLHYRYLINTLHCRYMINTLHCRYMINTLHYRYLINTLHCRYMINTLHYRYMINTLHYRYMINTLTVSIHDQYPYSVNT